jgi:hypothetical protein
MKKVRCVPSVMLLLVFFGLCASEARAAAPRADVFLGVSRLGQNTFYPNAGSQWGWNGAFSVRVRNFVSLEGDIAQYGLGADSYVPHSSTFMAGPRLTVGAVGVRVFVHGLAGVERVNNSGTSDISGSAMSVAGGGGIDLPVAPFFSWRVMADYIEAPSLDTAGVSHARVSTGVVFHF